MPDKNTGTTWFTNKNARCLWYAGACISAAMWMLQITVALHVVATAGTSALATLLLVGTLPTLFLMPFAGLAADRFKVHRLARTGVAVQLCAVVGMALAVNLDSLVALAVTFAVQGMALSFWAPSRQQWLYTLIEPEMRQKANAAIGTLNGAMVIVGAIGAGVVSLWSSTVSIFAVTGLLGMALMQLLRVDVIPPAADTSSQDGPIAVRRHVSDFIAGLRDGLGATQRFPLARSVIWIGMAWGLIGGGYTVLVNGHIIENFNGDSLTVAAVFTGDGLAVIIATLLAGRLPRQRHLPVWALCYVLQGLLWAAFFLAPNLYLAVAFLVLMRFVGGFIIALDTTILLETVPPEYRGRVTSLHITTYNAMARVSLAALGAALAIVSLVWVGIIAGVMAALCGVIWWYTSGRRAGEAYLKAAKAPEVSLRSESS
ncbi:MFS transporter [Haloglycomyces albus]|uniref:MFS transporter n=1 Tax=Haloglycomyces albus TaxID=526067 RepID=UPI00046D4F7A|nr:MFS transporter [Haloglycomyces albus]